MREFFRRMGNKLDKGITEAQAAEATARADNDKAHADLAQAKERMQASEARLNDLPNFIAQDHAEHLKEMEVNRKTRAENRERRKKELGEM